MNMNCKKARRLVSLKIDGMLSEGQAERLNRHLGSCVGCRAEWKALWRIHQAMALEAKTTASPGADVFGLIADRLELESVPKLKLKETKLTALRWRNLGLAGVAAGLVLSIALSLLFLGVRRWSVTKTESMSMANPELYLPAHALSASEVSALGDPAIHLVSIAFSGTGDMAAE